MKYPQLLESAGHVLGFLYSEVFLADDEVGCDFILYYLIG
jgi:hypothetical protein